uniref:Putative conserved secreted protein n=1 Tax=Rhipicephalus microplus TaxID=6941 RepID=A0A6G5A459_RHIMP
MDPVNLFLTLFMAASILSLSTQKNNMPWRRVGDGITVHARIFYDSTLNTMDVSGKNKEESRKPSMEEFKKLFKKVQDHFHDQFVMVSFQVEKAEKNDALVVRSHFNDYIIAIETLHNVTKSEPMPPKNDVVTYLFTKGPLYEGRWQSDLPGGELDYEATFDTFCSEKSSAAVVKYISMSSYDYTVAATAWILGLKKYKKFTYKDYVHMKSTFSRCGKNVR